MKILRRYKEPSANWEEVTLEECLEYTEGSGYWKEGSVEEILRNGQQVWTPTAEYKPEV